MWREDPRGTRTPSGAERARAMIRRYMQAARSPPCILHIPWHARSDSATFLQWHAACLASVTIETVLWGLLVIAYLASTFPLARQGWGRPSRGEPTRRAGVVHQLRRPLARRSGRAA